ncbi:PREDICTED: tetratricopeptide repeat protein 25-like [Dufourea novaeangliae]|uniref:Tetratricopeptide repeat protein 25 n=1 Tax=Dufourea novaeangliae TaxID=178035 RepID=A0A154P325_DUFNO|nr:PREDICTED: tetratricopeptide repeat protein 25-like [Dufourea novaeangliae]KZC06271.1 Tetratricopeptide repeat protein 25 [Dufourea novaeangliae]
MAWSGKEGSEFFREGIVYREWGYYLARLKKFNIAESYFEKAIKRGQDGDLRTFLGLCRTQVLYARYIRATATTENCIKIDPTYSHVKQMQLLTLFHVGEFEYSLVHAHQGFQKRRRTALEHGILQGNESVEGSVGRDTHPKALFLLSPWIHDLAEYRKLLFEKLQEEVDELAGIEEEQARFKVNDQEAQAEAQFRRLQTYIAKVYLGHLAVDKSFLQRLYEQPEYLDHPNKKSVDLLCYHVMKNYRRAETRMQIIRMRQPLYVKLFKRRAIPSGHKRMIEAEKTLRRNVIIIEADFLLRRLHRIRMSKDYVTFFHTVDRVKDKFDAYTLKMFPLRQKCLDAVYNMVAWAYIDTRDLRSLKTKELKKTYLKHHLGIRVAELPRDCDIGWVHARSGKEALRVFRKRLAMASEPLELAWLFHELCKFLIDIRRYDLARFYGKKAHVASEIANSEQWVLNVHHLILRIEISQNYRNEAKEAAVLAIGSAKKLGLDFLVDFYIRMLDMIDETDMEKMSDQDPIATRQQLILDLMPDDMKPEVDYLWRTMETVPAKRRLSVMPGCKPVDKKFKLACKRKSILPSPARDPEKEARKAFLARYELSKERPGYIDFNEFD